MRKMKTTLFNFKYKVIAIAVFLLSSIAANSQVADTIISNSVSINPNGQIKIFDTGFPIEIQTGEKDKLSVSYHLAVSADSKEDLKDFFNDFGKVFKMQMENSAPSAPMVNNLFKVLDFSDNKVKLKLMNGSKHELNQMNGKVIINLPKSVGLTINSSFHNLEIEDMASDVNIYINNAHLKMGDCNNLTLHSSFGNDLQVGTVKSAYVDVSSGKLEINKVEGDLELKGSFSDYKIRSVTGESKIEINSSSFMASKLGYLILKGSFIREFKVVEAGDISLGINSSMFYAQKIKSCHVFETSFSTIKIVDLEFLNVQSVSSTKFYFQDVWFARIFESSFSDFSIERLADTFELKSKSGNVKIGEVSANFLKIKIDGQFTSSNIHINEKANYKVEAQLMFPKYKFDNLHIESQNNSESELELKGWYGDKSMAKSSVTFNCESCNIKLE